MTKFKYRVFIPEFIEAKINRSTQEFEDDDFLSARNIALKYLTEIISRLVSEKIITVSDFKNEESSELIEVSELQKTPENDEVLDFAHLSECKIQYNYTEKEFRKANELQTEKKIALLSSSINKHLIKAD